MNGITNKPRIISSPEKYSPSVCRHLRGFIERLPLLLRPRPDRYEEGDVLDVSLRTVWPEVEGTARLRIRKFVGGGFAGQVYRCLLERLELPIGSEEDFGLRPGTDYAVKIFIPPSRLARLFRDALYRLGFQAPFSAQVNESACRAGLLFQKLARRTARVLLDDENAVADVYASFFDATLGSFGEIREWVEGRFWRLEADVHPWRRRRWRTTSATDTDSPEYVAKRRFMYRVVAMLHEMGARELARQFEWWSMKSQPNILKRAGYDDSPDAGLCAFDFRPGLVLLPFLPMSPVDVRLIWEGLCRGVLVQFDRCEPKKLRALVERHPQVFCGADDLLSAWERYHEAARRAVPDLSRQGLRLLFDFRLRRDVRFGLVEGYVRTGLIDECFAARLRKSSRAFWSFYLLGAVPLFGHWFRRLWGSEIYRRHVRLLLGDRLYLARTWAAALAARLLRWHRSGRIGRGHTRRLLRRPWLFWIERLTLGCLPAVVHRVLSEPGYVVQRIGAAWVFMRTFYRDAAFRQQWLAAVVEEGHAQGMLDARERDAIMARLGDPFIATYLKCVAVHFATLPLTQIVSATVGLGLAFWTLAQAGTWQQASARFAAVIVLFQVIPISPGSFCRGLYVVYRMIRDRNFRDYMVAAPLSFVKYIGYLAFPIQMATTYPALARFMAGRWAAGAVHIVPVFGERGALLEHMVFDAFFNVPRIIGRFVAQHTATLLNLWLLAGLAICGFVFGIKRVPLFSKGGINLLLAVTALFILPRALFYPVLKGRQNRQNRSGP